MANFLAIERYKNSNRKVETKTLLQRHKKDRSQSPIGKQRRNVMDLLAKYGGLLNETTNTILVELLFNDLCLGGKPKNM